MNLKFIQTKSRVDPILQTIIAMILCVLSTIALITWIVIADSGVLDINTAFLMERFAYLDEDAFWQRCRDTIEAYNQSGITSQSRIDAAAAAEPTLAVESLLARKIVSASGSGYLTHNIRNAMHPSHSKGE